MANGFMIYMNEPKPQSLCLEFCYGPFQSKGPDVKFCSRPKSKSLQSLCVFIPRILPWFPLDAVLPCSERRAPLKRSSNIKGMWYFHVHREGCFGNIVGLLESCQNILFNPIFISRLLELIEQKINDFAIIKGSKLNCANFLFFLLLINICVCFTKSLQKISSSTAHTITGYKLTCKSSVYQNENVWTLYVLYKCLFFPIVFEISNFGVVNNIKLFKILKGKRCVMSWWWQQETRK